MISCPAANEIRCVKPSIATVSPSWTSSATASRIVVTLLELMVIPSASRLPARIGDVGALRVGVDQVVAERGGPERRHADGIGHLEGERVGRHPHYAPASTSATTSSKISSAARA